MRSPTPLAPPVHVVLHGRPPAPARLRLVPRPAVRRLALGVLVVAFAGGVAAALPGGASSPWALAALTVGLAAAWQIARARHAVGSFMGLCPACGADLRVRLRGTIELPRRLRCAGCGAHPELRLRPRERTAAGRATALRHLLPLCTGSWRTEWLWDEAHLACDACCARLPATPELRREADGENRSGELLARLADEGRYL
jgi:hypothetical protein